MNFAPSDSTCSLTARAHVGRLDHRAQALGGGDGLQAGHAHAQDHHARGLHRARGRHQHGEEALVQAGRDHHGLVAGDIGLRRQHVHALGARGARRRFQRETGQAGAGQALQAGGIERVEHADHGGGGFHQPHFAGGGVAHLQHQLAAEGAGHIGDLAADRLEGLVGDAGRQARARLDPQAVALRLQFPGRLGSDGNTGFTRRGFSGNANLHIYDS